MMNKYLEIIKKQQELINLLIKTGVNNEIKDACETTQIQKIPADNQVVKYDLVGFKKYLEAKGMSQNCINTYFKQIELFFRTYSKMNVDTLTEYENEFQNVAPKTANLRIAAMNKYFKFINYTDYEFKRVKEQKKTFCDNAINEEQYNTLIEWAKINSQKVYIIAKIIGSTGVRVSELITLKTADLDKGYADIVGKGNKQRRIYYPKQLVDDIKPLCDKEYIITNRYGQQITTRGISGLLEKAGYKAGIPKEVMHPHSFRHFFAKQFLKEKNDITLLGDLLGHSNISTTAIYTRLTSDEQQEEINKIINW